MLIKTFIALLITINLYASDVCLADEQALQIAEFYGIDLRTKSTKGWIRLFKNTQKCRKYHMTKGDRLLLITCLTNYHKNKPDIGSIS